MIAISAASGRLGSLVAAELKNRDDVVAIVRNPEKGASLPIPYRVADYGSQEAMTGALDGVDKLLMVAAADPAWLHSDIDIRVNLCLNVINAARKAGVSHIFYTGVPNTLETELWLFKDHRRVAEALVASGIAYTLLNYNLHPEAAVMSVIEAHQTGGFIGMAGDGRIASASHYDYAAATANILTTSGHENKVMR